MFFILIAPVETNEGVSSIEDEANTTIIPPDHHKDHLYTHIWPARHSAADLKSPQQPKLGNGRYSFPMGNISGRSDDGITTKTAVTPLKLHL